MSALLIGDFDIYTWYKEKRGKAWDTKLIFENQDILNHAFNQILHYQLGVIRLPTLLMSSKYLQGLQLENKLETMVNTCVASAKNCIERSKADALIAGCIGPIEGLNQSGIAEEVHTELAKLIVYLSDFGVEYFHLQGFTELTELQTVIELVQKIQNLPTGVFLSIKKKADFKKIVPLYHLARTYSLDMIGVEIEMNLIHKVIPLFQDREIPFGLIINESCNLSDKTEEELITHFIRNHSNVIFGGTNFSYLKWSTYSKRLKSKFQLFEN